MTKWHHEEKSCRERLAISVAKECKCENVAEVNHGIIGRNNKLREQLKEANDILTEVYSWIDIDNEGVETKEMKIAFSIREYKEKYNQ